MLRTNPAGDKLPAFSEVVENVRNGRPEGLDQLYKVFRILSGSLRRQIGFQDFDDRIHDMFIVVAEAIREGKLREPGALPSYIHGIARLSLCSKLGARSRHGRLSGSLRHWVQVRHSNRTPEEALAQREESRLMQELLACLPEREREILVRFYLREETKEAICEELRLTETQFRLTKSRAKQRLSRLGEQRFRWAAVPARAA